MRSDLSAAHDAPRPFVTALARSSAVALLSLLIVTCHSEPMVPTVPKSLVFTVQPSGGNAVTALSPAIQVSAQDGSGHTISSFNGPITVALGNNPGGATLSGTKTVNAISGVAVFSSLVLNRPGGNYTLTASTTAASGVTGTSAAFAIVPGSVAQLVFNVEPTNTIAGLAIAPAIQVTAQDAAANVVTTFGGNVSLAIGTNPSGGTLSGTPTVAASSGVATFNNISIDKAGPGYKLTATAGAGSAQSAAFDITAAAATQLVFTVQPGQTAAGSSISPAVVVTAEDQFQNIAGSFSNPVAIAITAGTGKPGASLSGTKSQGASSGVANFVDLSIDSVGTGYTLSATATGLVGAFASATFNIIPGAATRLVFTVQPAASTTAGVAITPAVQVTARDAKGNTATGFTSAVKLAISAGTGTPGAKLSGGDTVTASAVGGLASFATLSIDKSGSGYTLSASSTGLTSATSSAFTIAVGAAAKLAFTVQPVNTAAGAAISPAVQVSVQDNLGNTVTGSSASVVVAITSNTGTAGALLTGGASVTATASGGVATFSGIDSLGIDKVGNGYTLTATSSALTSATSTAFNIFANTATHLVFTVQPTNAVAGPPATIPAVRVTALDASNNPVPGFTGGVTVTITSGTGALGATLAGSKTVNAVLGVATFSNLSIDKTGDGYTLDASASALTGVTSTAFKITPAAATHLVFTLGQPSNAVAGAVITPPVKVAALDALQNIDTAFAGNVTIGIGTNAGNGSLGGTLIRPGVNGIATFNDLTVDKSGIDYQLLATAGALTSPLSAKFTITAALAKQMAFTVQPVTTTAGLAITPTVVVTVEDSLGNTATGFNNPVKVAISSGTGTLGAHLTHADTVTVTAASGVATFSGVQALRIDSAGAGYILSASTAGLTAALSTSFNIRPGNATTLVFTAQPTSATAGVAIAPPVVVTARDSLGNRDTTFKTGITVAITGGTGTVGAHLSHGASVTQTAAAGLATFSTLSVDSAGNNYTLSASATGVGGPLTGGPSATFNIASAPAVSLVITGQPVTTVAGAAIAVQVTARDSLGNTAKSFVSSPTLSILTNGGNPVPGALSGGCPAATQGVANCSISIDKVGTGYTIQTTAPLTSAPSLAFNITPAALDHLVFTGQPSQTTTGATISPALVITAVDFFANTVPTFNNNVTVAIGNNAGGGGTVLSGSLTRAAASGVATFSNLSINNAGTGYTLTATGTGVPNGGTSGSFNIITSTATQLFFTVQPGNAVAGTAIPGSTGPTIQVSVRDASGQTVTGFVGNVTIAISTNAGGGTLTGTVPQPVSGGVATFNDLQIDKTGIGYKLTASTGGVTSATSRFFTITPGPAAALFFTLQPSLAQAGATVSPQVEVTARDAKGNTATGFGGSVALALSGGTAGAVLGGTTPKTAISGVATFSDLNVNLSGTGYILHASSAGVTNGTSSGFDIGSSAPDQLVFTTQPTTTTAGATINASGGVKVTVLNGVGGTDVAYSGSVTLTITGGTGTNGATLSGTVPVVVNSGVATFTDLSINRRGTGYKLSATAPNASGATSSSFTINDAAPNRVQFTSQPLSATAGAAISTQATVRDAFGNPVKNFAGTVTLVLLPNPTGGTLSGNAPASVDPNTGIASFSGLSIDRSGDTYQLEATATGLSIKDTSSAFSISGGTATQLLFSVQPGTAKAGANINPAVRVTALDALGNVATGFTDNVTLAITNGTGTIGAILSGGTVAAVNGVATFPALNIDRIGTGYTLTATTLSIGSAAVSTGFNITADRLVFTVQPTDPSTHAVSITPAVKVAAEDGLGNIDQNFTGSVTIAKGSGSAGALSGTLTQPFASGVATFGDLQISATATGWTLKATSASLTATSTTFAVN